jgi:hypothetical protein
VHTIRRWVRAFGVALVVLLAVGGCGSSGDDDDVSSDGRGGGDDTATEDTATQDTTTDESESAEAEAAAGAAGSYEAGEGLCDTFDQGPFAALASDSHLAADYQVAGPDDPGVDDGRTESRCQLHGPEDAAEGDPSVAMDIDARFMAGPEAADRIWDTEAEAVGEDLYDPFDPGPGDPWASGRGFSSQHPDTAEAVTTVDLLDGNLFLTCRLQRFHAPDVADERAAEACAAAGRQIFAHHLVDG